MRSISRCLNKQLAEICLRSVQLEELANKIKLILPESLANACNVGSFNKGCLLLTTTDAAWASQLRYAIPDLRDTLRKEAGMYSLTSIKVAVVEPTTHYKTLMSHKNQLSEKTKAMIISESQLCTYEPLQRALMHLADGKTEPDEI